MHTTRRDLLKATLGSTAFVSLTSTVPQFLLSTSLRAAEQPVRTDSDRVLVIVELAGGNDGLNTVIPHGHDIYQRNRKLLRIGGGQVHRINDELGLHPSMGEMAGLLEEGKLAVVQGVGYPNPNRSHFESMDIWHSTPRGAKFGEGQGGGRTTGWLGRYLDLAAAAEGRDAPAIHLGPERQPLALDAHQVRVPSVRDLDGFRLETGNDATLRTTIESAAAAERPESNDLLQFMQRSTVGAFASSRRVQEALTRYTTPVTYPPSALAGKLRTIAQLIEAGLSTRVYYVSLGGFDTHANQADAHAALLRELSQAVGAFVRDVEHHGHGKRVLVMTFSEFGRRVKENASMGTDHGAAGPMFLAGAAVRPGLIGEHPPMTDLIDGDLKHHTDFRQVYAAMLTNWLRFENVEPILNGTFEPANVLA